MDTDDYTRQSGRQIRPIRSRLFGRSQRHSRTRYIVSKAPGGIAQAIRRAEFQGALTNKHTPATPK